MLFRFHTGAAALAQARHEPPACVVIDVRLPDMEGWQLCQAIKADASLKATPVVILTGDVTPQAARDSAASGCSSWLAHPSAAHDVPRVVAHVLAQGRPSPESATAAIIGVTSCRACESSDIRATLRLGAMQYYTCFACKLSWRVDSVESVA